jgi:hypothetical protein
MFFLSIQSVDGNSQLLASKSILLKKSHFNKKVIDYERT